MNEIIHKEISSLVIKAFFNVYNELGYGFLERVYENAMLQELRSLGLEARSQIAIDVFYKEEKVGDYFADIIVNNLIILELKAESAIHPRHEAQLVNYLKATHIELGLLLNFGPKPQFSRKILMNNHK